MCLHIKEVLHAHGINQIELANRLQINRVSVSRLLSDKNDLRISTLQKIAEAIGCDVADFFREENRSDFVALIRREGKVFSASTLAELKELIAGWEAG